jgi:hypothetical protein
LFARLKAKAAIERVTLKQLLRHYVEQGLESVISAPSVQRSAVSLPWLEGPLVIPSEQLSNAGLFELLDS